MSTTPGAMYAPWRAVAGGTTRTPFSAQPVFSGILSWYSYGPTSVVCIPRARKDSRIAFFAHSLTCQPVSVGAATRISPSSSIVITCSTVSAASSSSSDVGRSKSSSMRAARAVRSVVDMTLRLDGGEKLRGSPALVEGGDERRTHVALAAGAEERAGGDDDAELVEEPQREGLGVAVAGDAEPEEEARVAAGRLEPDPLQRGQDDVPLAPVALARLDDMLLVAPGDDRRALHERRRRGADVRPVALQCRDELAVAGREARAVAGHRGALGKRVERQHVRAVGDLQHARGGVAREPQLGVRLVAGEHEAARARERGGALEEVKRRGGGGRGGGSVFSGVSATRSRRRPSRRPRGPAASPPAGRAAARAPRRRRTARPAPAPGSRAAGPRSARPARRPPERGRRWPPSSRGSGRSRCRGRGARRSASRST